VVKRIFSGKSFSALTDIQTISELSRINRLTVPQKKETIRQQADRFVGCNFCYYFPMISSAKNCALFFLLLLYLNTAQKFLDLSLQSRWFTSKILFQILLL